MTEPSYCEADDGVRLAYRRYGSGPVRVIAPALSWMAADLELLAEAAGTVFYDVRGQGSSAAVADDQVGLQRDVADLDAVRRSVGAGQVALLGWSYYGAIALQYALAHPAQVTRLALFAPVAPRAQPYWRQYLHAFGQRLDSGRLGDLEAARKAGTPRSDPSGWCRAHIDLLLRIYVENPECLARMRASPCVAPNLDPERVNRQTLRVMEGMGDYDWRAAMRALECPVRIWHGDRDPVPLAGSHEWCEALPDARLVPLAGCGHMPWLEQPDACLPALQAFLTSG